MKIMMKHNIVISVNSAIAKLVEEKWRLPKEGALDIQNFYQESETVFMSLRMSEIVCIIP